ncbi:hypothetical protein [Pseudomonas phage LY218]|uniref:Uncharacterized protein n=1 Tax=Pseudomonas phage phi176 TaxID=1541891 RepID=A0A0A7NPB0_9CAUD|nr:hypothetical protein [Pseudomonas phage phi176]QHZ59463.1 hypothetical protein [Pseudomonas phage LY218]
MSNPHSVFRVNKCLVRMVTNGELITSPTIHNLEEMRDYIRNNCKLTDTGIRLSCMSETEGCEVILAYFNHYGNIIV